jgi:hypothetical protein
MSRLTDTLTSKITDIQKSGTDTINKALGATNANMMNIVNNIMNSSSSSNSGGNVSTTNSNGNNGSSSGDFELMSILNGSYGVI